MGWNNLKVQPADKGEKEGGKQQREEQEEADEGAIISTDKVNQHTEPSEEEVVKKADANNLSTYEFYHYTLEVLKMKGVELRPISVGVDNLTATKYRLELINPEDSSPAFPKAHLGKTFNTMPDALYFVRVEGSIVSRKDLLECAEKDPYKPLFDAMIVADRRLGIGGAEETFANVRADEANVLVDFYEECLLKSQGGWIRIGGLPGTGKTLTVERTKHLLASSLASKGIEDGPTFVNINCGTDNGPDDILRAFLRGIMKKRGDDTYDVPKRDLLGEIKTELAPYRIDNKSEDIFYLDNHLH